jgi:hypothetical protein
MRVTEHLSWVYVLEAAAERFCLDPETLDDVRRKGIPAMLEWAKETGVRISIPDETPPQAADALTRLEQATDATAEQYRSEERAARARHPHRDV